MDDDLRIERGSGNVFADLDLPNPELALLKADLALHITRAIDENGWTDDQAARELQMSSAAIVAIVRGNLSGFSTDDLLRVLQQLNFDVNIAIGPNESPRRSARASVFRADEASGEMPDSFDASEEERRGRSKQPLISASG